MEIAFQTDIGRRRSQNQDRVAQYTDKNGHQLVVIADGIGGNLSGDVAAEMTVKRLGHRFKLDSPENPLEAIRWFAREVQIINDPKFQE